jgi:hypothetical protein
MYPFMCLGSTAIACAALEVNFDGVELDQHYLGEAVQRVRDATSHPDLLSSAAEGP